MDAAHALLEPVRVPRDVVIEEDVAALEVDAFAGRLGGDEHLNRALPELLLGVQPGAGVVARADVHAAVNGADREAPLAQLLHEVVERVLELGEDEQPLLRVVEEALLLQQVVELGELRLAVRILDRGWPARRVPSVRRFPPCTCSGFRASADGRDHVFQPFALGVLHLVQFVHVGQVGRRVPGNLLRLLQHLSRGAWRGSPASAGAQWVLDARRRWYSAIRKRTARARGSSPLAAARCDCAFTNAVTSR